MVQLQLGSSLVRAQSMLLPTPSHHRNAARLFPSPSRSAQPQTGRDAALLRWLPGSQSGFQQPGVKTRAHHHAANAPTPSAHVDINLPDAAMVMANMLLPMADAVGGVRSWQYYLISRFFKEVFFVLALVYAAYWLLLRLAKQGSEMMAREPPAAATVGRKAGAAANTAAAARDADSGPATAGGAGGGGISGELLRLVPVALTGGPALLFIQLVLLVNVVRNSAVIVYDYISIFNPKLPNNWLDDVFRILGQSLTPLDAFLTKLSLVGSTLFGLVVLMRWKDVMVAWLVRHHVEPMEKGPELVTGFINPASNLTNWLLMFGTGMWLAVHLGLNLQPLLAVGGASGIVIGLATQQVLGNFVSGLNIFLARPFVAGEYISILSANLAPTAVTGKVIRVDPMRTLIATEDHATIAVPNKLIAECVVTNRSRAPHWTVGSASPLLAHPRELRFRMKLPHAALDKLEELQEQLEAALGSCLPVHVVRRTTLTLELIKVGEAGAEMTGKCNLVWRMRRDGSGSTSTAQARQHAEAQEAQEAVMQRAMLQLNRVVRASQGALLVG